MKTPARLIYRLTATLLILASLSAAADIPPVGGASLMQNYDKKTGAQGMGYDVNAAVLFINGGVSLRHWNNTIIGWNGHSLNNEAALFVGVGMFNLIEVQRGYSNAGSRTRIRADIVLSDQFPFASNETWGQFKKGIVLTPFIELAGDKKVYGMGIGLQFD